jgi:hypothetical protein
MLTPKETNALIHELKKNREDMLPKIKLPLSKSIKDLSEVIHFAAIEKLESSGSWDISGWHGADMNGIYSLPADFPEVPEVTEGWVVVPVDDDGLVGGSGWKVNWYSWRSVLLDRPPLTHFGGYLWESKRYPGKYTMSYGPLGLDAQDWHSSVTSRWIKPLTPKALRFWSTDVAKSCTLGFKPWNADEWPKV